METKLKGIFCRTAKVYKLDLLKVVALIHSSKGRLTGSFRSPSKSKKYVNTFEKQIKMLSFHSNFVSSKNYFCEEFKDSNYCFKAQQISEYIKSISKHF